MRLLLLLPLLLLAPVAHAEVLEGCPDVIVERFGAQSETACAISYCESTGWDNHAIGRAGEVSTWQIHPIHFWRYDRQRLIDDIEYATEVAWLMSNGGRNWSAWSCWR